MLKFKSAAPGL